MSGAVPRGSDGRPRGLEFSRLAQEVKEGFMALVVPMLKRGSPSGVAVHVREHEEVRSDLRISVGSSTDEFVIPSEDISAR